MRPPNEYVQVNNIDQSPPIKSLTKDRWKNLRQIEGKFSEIFLKSQKWFSQGKLRRQKFLRPATSTPTNFSIDRRTNEWRRMTKCYAVLCCWDIFLLLSSPLLLLSPAAAHIHTRERLSSSSTLRFSLDYSKKKVFSQCHRDQLDSKALQCRSCSDEPDRTEQMTPL